jgi:restriction endonuclease S subunit
MDVMCADVIPADWDVCSLAEMETSGLVRLSRGNVISRKDIWQRPGGYPIYSSSVHDDGLFGRYGEFMFDEELITWSVDGGGHFFHRPRHRFSVTNVCGYMRVDTRRVDYPYLAYQLQQLHSRLLFDYQLKAHPSVIRGAYSVPLPGLSEQRAIAEALSDVDALLDGLDRLIAKKRDLKQAAMQQLLSGRTRLPGFHGEWEAKTLGDLFRFSGGYSASRSQLSTAGHCYLHYGDIHGATQTCVDAHADYQDIPKLDIPLNRVSPGSLLRDGDVVFVDASEDDEGTSKHVVVVNEDNVPFISGLHTIVAKGRTDELAHEYRSHCFQTAAIRQQFLFYAVGKKVTGISKTNIPKLTLPVPSVPEQLAIAAVLSDMDAETDAVEARRDKTRDLKQAMMQELLTGRTRLVPTGDAHA